MTSGLFKAFLALMLFRPYTIFPRWIEVGLGITGWMNVAIIVYSLILIL